MATWPGNLDPYIAPQLKRSALLVIDTQVDFADGGAAPIAGTTQVLPEIARLLGAYRAARLPIVYAVRLYEGDDVDLSRRALIAAGAPLVAPGSPGSQLVPEIRPAGAEALDPALLRAGRLQRLAEREWALWKPRWGAFHRTHLDDHLRAEGVTTVVIAGCNYPNCPRAAVYGASERDYRVLIASDAVSVINPQHLEEAALIGAVHAPTATIVAGLSDLIPD